MKLSKEQKKILKSIPNKKIRLEQKLQFKIQNRFFSRKPIVFKDGKFETDDPFLIQFLSQHSMNGTLLPENRLLFKEEVETSVDFMKGYPWYGSKPVNFPELTSREKALYKIIEIRREFDKSANDNTKQFTLEDMRKAYFTAVIDYLKTDNGKREYNGEILFNKFTESLINT